MTRERLLELQERGWRLTRDGSTGTAFFAWEDPLDPDSGWEVLVLHTAGHRNRFTLEPSESGLTERSLAEVDLLLRALQEARELQAEWQGELPDEEA